MIQAGERRAKVKVFAIGLDAYWEQFPGLKERLEGYQQGSAHHCGLGVGHHAGTLRKVARLLGLEFVAVREAGRG